MIRSFKRCAFALAILCLPACANSQTPLADKTPAPPPVLLLDFTQSGGLIDIRDHLVVMSDGMCTVERKEEKSEFTIEAEELEALRELLKDCHPDPPQPKTDGPVRVVMDGITYAFKTAEQDFTCYDPDVSSRLRKVVEEFNKRFINRKL